MFTALVLAAGLVTAPAVTSAPVEPLKVDMDALKTGQLPAAGTREEADACAVHTQLVAIFVVGSGKFPKERVDQVTDVARAWLQRAGDFRKVTADVMQSDKASSDVVMAWAKVIGADQLGPLESECVNRLGDPEAK